MEILEDENLKLLNGNPSIINFLDALNALQLVNELQKATHIASATSFKHVTPSGAALGNKITTSEISSYNYKNTYKEELTRAYLKARGSDRLASFGDFIALSETVQAETARLIKSEVSDGIIAPGYTAEALALLKEKKKGTYCIIEINKDYLPPTQEKRVVYGFELKQDRNEVIINNESLSNIRTANKGISDQVIQNLLVGMITLKYTQSNSISIIYDGHVIGIGSGQQSRIPCSELALSKANRWYQKTKINYDQIAYSKEKISKTEKDNYHDQIRKEEFNETIMLNELNDLCLCSDGFFPQIDNIELANQFGIKHIAAPMGSIKDKEIIETCEKYGMTFIDTGIRLFHH
ncbi:MAG: phosphoribosylaminoimidazolecarboxamide formyltransferase [Spirochaetaceae bacterium]|nr:phosphoribosylaminoimidazolecarboxamide formyltransferase [Spirochaetaceae bacterium]